MINIKTTNQGINTGYDLKITNSEGQELKHVSAIDIRCRPDEVTTASVWLTPMIEITANSGYFLMHPIGGAYKRVKRIEFYDHEDFIC